MMWFGRMSNAWCMGNENGAGLVLTLGGCKYQARKLLDLALTPKERAMFTAMGQL